MALVPMLISFQDGGEVTVHVEDKILVLAEEELGVIEVDVEDGVGDNTVSLSD